MPEETVGSAELAVCDCGPCRKRKGERAAVREGIIHSYESEPRGGWRCRYTAAEMSSQRTVLSRTPTFGVELETSVAPSPLFRFAEQPPHLSPHLRWATDDELTANERTERDRIRAQITDWQHRYDAAYARWTRRNGAPNSRLYAEEAVSLSRPRGFWHAKHDSSVSGPEFASQPASLAYWRSQRTAITEMFTTLLHGGMRSHDGDKCGMHVNIGTDTFGVTRSVGNPEMAGHLERFAKLIASNQRWTIRMSQRTHDSAFRWAHFDGFATDGDRRRWAERMSTSGYASTDHCSVLNTSNPGRVEFRIPRGTLRVDRFYAKLEWVASMIEFTRNPENVVRISDYMRWCQQSGEYPALVAYMRERFHADRFGGESSLEDQTAVPA